VWNTSIHVTIVSCLLFLILLGWKDKNKIYFLGHSNICKLSLEVCFASYIHSPTCLPGLFFPWIPHPLVLSCEQKSKRCLVIRKEMIPGDNRYSERLVSAILYHVSRIEVKQLGMVVHTCNPNTQEPETVRYRVLG
jgi:hypothetical protein